MLTEKAVTFLKFLKKELSYNRPTVLYSYPQFSAYRVKVEKQIPFYMLSARDALHLGYASSG